MTATTEPTRITAGDTITWLKSLADYPATDGWVLAYTLINAAAKITITATASGADHLVSVSAATSTGYAAGTYSWQATVTLGGVRHTLATGSIVIAANMAAATLLDGRTSARKALDAVNALLETYGSKAYMQAYEINGRSQKFHTPGEFLAFRSQLQAEVAREENAARIAAGLAPKNQVYVRFNTR